MTAAPEVSTLEIEQVIGERIVQAREDEGWSQTELGRRLGEILGKPWSRQAVWNAEHGRRVFTAVELLAPAHVFGTTVEHLMRPLAQHDRIDLPNGESLEWSDLVGAALPQTPQGNALYEVQTAVADVTAIVANIKSGLDELAEAVKGLGGDVDKAVRQARTQ